MNYYYSNINLILDGSINNYYNKYNFNSNKCIFKYYRKRLLKNIC